MADYLTIATINLLVGLEISYLGFINLEGGRHEDVEALLIIAILCALISAVLIILIKAGDMAGNMVAMCCVIGFGIAAAVFHLAGSALWCDDHGGDGCGNSYVMTLNIVGAFLTAIGAIFVIVVVASGSGGSQTSPA